MKKIICQTISALICAVISCSNVFASTIETYSKNQKDFNAPRGLFYDEYFGLIVADFDSGKIKSVKDGKVSIVADAYKSGGTVFNLFKNPTDVAVNRYGEILAMDTTLGQIKKIDQSKNVTLYAGINAKGYYNLNLLQSKYRNPTSIAFNSKGDMFFTDTLNHIIYKVDVGGKLILFAGSQEVPGYHDGRLLQASFREPMGIAIDADDVIYVADKGNNVIRKIEDGKVSTFAGARENLDIKTNSYLGGYVNDISARAKFKRPTDVATTEDGKVFVADTGNNVIRLIENGKVTTAFGNGEAKKDYSSYINIKLNAPQGIFYKDNILYISDTLNNDVISVEINEETIKPKQTREEVYRNIRTKNKHEVKSVYVNSNIINFSNSDFEVRNEEVYVSVFEVLKQLKIGYNMDASSNAISIAKENERIFLEIKKDFEMAGDVPLMEISKLASKINIRCEWFEDKNIYVLVNN